MSDNAGYTSPILHINGEHTSQLQMLSLVSIVAPISLVTTGSLGLVLESNKSLKPIDGVTQLHLNGRHTEIWQSYRPIKANIRPCVQAHI